VTAAVLAMQDGLAALPEDPFLLYSTEPSRSDRIDAGAMPSPDAALSTVLSGGEGTDLVGISASGPIERGFASSLGHRHFHEVSSFQLDWSLYQSTDKAVSSSYATSRFDEAELRARMARSRAQLEHLARPAKTVAPGGYRTYLSPAALSELVLLFNWGGVSAKAQRTKTSALQRLADGEARFSPRFTLRERTADGLAPAFDEVGFEKPPSVDLVVEGLHAGALVSPRSAREYSLVANAGAEETLASADVAPGALPESDVLAALDTGIYVSNLWYLNFSDRANGRVTGMTRFATFWVEHGRIVAPLNVMRFDDSLYRLLGTELRDFTRERHVIQSTSTYGQRSVETLTLPGALIDSVSFTL
jgi:predicted Zn-dependent protease